MHKIDMWIQGACYPNPGAGAYAVLLRFGEHEKFISGTLESETTNQRCDIQSAIEGISAIKEGWLCDITIYTSSKYLVKSMSGEWDVKSNADLFKQLENTIGLHKVNWYWLKARSTLEGEQCSMAAEAEARKAFSAAGAREEA